MCYYFINNKFHFQLFYYYLLLAFSNSSLVIARHQSDLGHNVLFFPVNENCPANICVL
eukprot:m.205439 g.205439  ORF g.205439 m.205439 type:complete len:58 (+) comp13747_c0_seq23:2147-2320(+)